VSITTGYFIKTKFLKSSIIESPNTPPTFNFTHDQIKEINDFLDQGGVLNEETALKHDQDIKTIMGDELYAQFLQDTKQIEDDFAKELADILNSEISGLDYQTILDIINFIINFFN